jgi:hypothetical protein
MKQEGTETSAVSYRHPHPDKKAPAARSSASSDSSSVKSSGAVAELVGIECGVVSGVFNLESSGIEVPDWRPRHDKHYHEA